MRKKIILITLLISLVLIATGCGANETNVNNEVNDQCEKLMKYFGNNDTDGIKEMFCTAVSDSPNFENELQEAVEFFDGEVDSYDLKGIGSDDKTELGKTKYVHVSPKIRDVKTNTGKNYKVSYYAYIVNTDDPEYVGISEIQIKSDDGTEFKLGDYSLANPK